MYKHKCININKTLSYTQNKWYVGTPKTSTSIRVVTIGDTLCRILEEYKAYQMKNKLQYGKYYVKNLVKDGWINEDTGEEYDFVLIEKWGKFAKPTNMERYCRDHGFKYHSLRHTHATKLIESGVSPKVVQERLGHSNIAITLQTYTHPTEQMQRDAAEKFEMWAK